MSKLNTADEIDALDKGQKIRDKLGVVWTKMQDYSDHSWGSWRVDGNEYTMLLSPQMCGIFDGGDDLGPFEVLGETYEEGEEEIDWDSYISDYRDRIDDAFHAAMESPKTEANLRAFHDLKLRCEGAIEAIERLRGDN